MGWSNLEWIWKVEGPIWGSKLGTSLANIWMKQDPSNPTTLTPVPFHTTEGTKPQTQFQNAIHLMEPQLLDDRQSGRPVVWRDRTRSKNELCLKESLVGLVGGLRPGFF